MTKDDAIERILSRLDPKRVSPDMEDSLRRTDTLTLARQAQALERLTASVSRVRDTQSGVVDIKHHMPGTRADEQATLLASMERAMVALANAATASVRSGAKPAKARAAKSSSSKLPLEREAAKASSGMVVIRLARGGAKKRPFYNIVVADSRERRDGRFIERVGFYNPMAAREEDVLRLALRRVEYWMGVGATASPAVGKLMRDAQNFAETPLKVG